MDEPKKKKTMQVRNRRKKNEPTSRQDPQIKCRTSSGEKKYWLSYRPIHKTSQTFMTYEYKYMPQKIFIYVYVQIRRNKSPAVE